MKSSYGRTKKLRQDTKSYRDCFSLAIYSHHLLGQTKPVYFYNLEAMLKVWLSTSDNAQRLENFHNTPINPGVYDSPKNAEIYQQLSITSPDPVILLAIFCDEVTPFGSLYAKSSAYKLFNFYVIVILPGPKQRKLEQVFPICLILSADITELGLEQVTEKIAQMFTDLISHGFEFNGRRYQARVIYVVGDNLGQNQLAGLTLSWRSGKSCRFCHYRMSGLQNVNRAADLCTGEERTSLEYEETIEKALNNEQLSYGFTNMPSFHTIPYLPKNTSSFTLDVDHDFYIGCALHWMGFIINKIVFELNWLSPSTMIAAWKRIKFVKEDSRNRPYMKFDTAKKTVKLCSKVSQIKCLIHCFSIVLYPFIRDTKHLLWKFYLILLHLSRLLRTNRHTDNSLVKLEEYINSALNIRIALTKKPDGQFDPTVRSKDHNLTHYPTTIRRNGPLSLQSSSLGEQFHQICKQCYGNSRCSKHLLTTLQRRMDSKILSRTKKDSLECKSVALKKLTNLDQMSTCFYELCNDPSSWVKSFTRNGYHFGLGTLVGIPRRDNEFEPRFFLISGIIKQGPNFQLAQRNVEIIGMDHLGLFQLKPSANRPRRRNWSESLVPIPYYQLHNGQNNISVFSLKDFNLHRK